ncbi:hypothetical protein NMG60_11024681 [Bertholletia excelsa]
MKMRNKGKVYPSPSSSSSTPTCDSNRDALSVLKLLPAAILALASVLSLEDREVLAYMITRSMKSANPSSIIEEKKKNSRKSNTHKPPLFDCECFDCYTSFWFRWDSSPNGELIHQAIEAFEEHLASGEQSKRTSRGKKKEKMSRRAAEKLADISGKPVLQREADVPARDDGFTVVQPENDDPDVALPVEAVEEEVVDESGNESPEQGGMPAEATFVLRGSSPNNHKGLARKVLPDVVGIFNSRLWSLWSPNV